MRRSGDMGTSRSRGPGGGKSAVASVALPAAASRRRSTIAFPRPCSARSLRAAGVRRVASGAAARGRGRRLRRGGGRGAVRAPAGKAPSEGAARGAASGRPLRGAATAPASISPRAWPTATVSPVWRSTLRSTPATGAGTTTVAFSLSTSTTGSSCATDLPLLLQPRTDLRLRDALAQRRDLQLARPWIHVPPGFRISPALPRRAPAGRACVAWPSPSAGLGLAGRATTEVRASKPGTASPSASRM